MCHVFASGVISQHVCTTYNVAETGAVIQIHVSGKVVNLLVIFYLQLGQKKVADDCGTEYICKEVDGKSQLVLIKNVTCDAFAHCGVDSDGTRVCVCDYGFGGDGLTCKGIYNINI